MSTITQTIPRDVARKLGHYVYAYVNPLDDKIFYVGKGKGHRILSHLRDHSDTKESRTGPPNKRAQRAKERSPRRKPGVGASGRNPQSARRT